MIVLNIIMNQTSFKSNPERERELARLRELEKKQQEAFERERELARLREFEKKQQKALEQLRELEKIQQKALERQQRTLFALEAKKETERTIEREKNGLAQLNELEKKQEEAMVHRATLLSKNEEKKIHMSEALQSINQYPEVDNNLSKEMAGFISQFTCAIQNNSEHDVKEFFGDEETAKELRSKLSPECQRDSLELRNELKNIAETNDPIMMFMCANKMKNFTPKKGLLTEQQYLKLVDSLKESIVSVVNRMDLTKFTQEEQGDIIEIIQMIKAANSVDFGISVKLKALVDKINKRKLNIGYIPPVTVKNLEIAKKTIKL